MLIPSKAKIYRYTDEFSGIFLSIIRIKRIRNKISENILNLFIAIIYYMQLHINKIKHQCFMSLKYLNHSLPHEIN